MLLFWLSAQTKKTIITRSLVDRGTGIWDFQHCIVITRGWEERIPKTASAVGTNFGLRLFSLFFSFLRLFVFSKDFNGFCYDLDILGSDFDILGILGVWDKCAVFVFHLSLSFIFLCGNSH